MSKEDIEARDELLQDLDDKPGEKKSDDEEPKKKESFLDSILKRKQKGEPTPKEIVAEGDYVLPIIGITLPRAMMPWLIVGILVILALGWTFLRTLPATWFHEEGYYSHGILVPFMTLAIIYMRRDKIKEEPLGTSWLGAVIMSIGLLVLLAGRRLDNASLQSGGFITCLIGGVYFAFGKQIARHIFGPLMFLVFMVPILGYVIDSTTNPLQLISTNIANKLLNIVGYNTFISPAYPTLVQMDNYSLNVGGPCSGFKLILALTAFTVFFVMFCNLGRFKSTVLAVLSAITGVAITILLKNKIQNETILFMLWLTTMSGSYAALAYLTKTSWADSRGSFLIFFVNPVLALFINGLRIMLIGVVGENAGSPMIQWMYKYGDDPGMVFHDWSGYLTLIACFIFLNYITKFLEGKKPDAVPA